MVIKSNLKLTSNNAIVSFTRVIKDLLCNASISYWNSIIIKSLFDSFSLIRFISPSSANQFVNNKAEKRSNQWVVFILGYLK